MGVGNGYLMGGYDRGQSMRAAGITAFLVGGLILLDRFMQAWPSYFNNSRVRGGPIATIGAGTPNIQGDFWVLSLDTFTHLILPTMALILISLASYTRFTRSSMLEIMNMDYIRTARAKGLSERTVVMGHAFRNALIPIATIVAFDIGGADRRCRHHGDRCSRSGAWGSSSSTASCTPTRTPSWACSSAWQ